MKFRTGLVIGFGIGFVVGARAGRERYEQIVAASQALIGDERFQKAASIAERGSNVARGVAGNGLMTASGKVREAASSRNIRITTYSPESDASSG